MVTAHCSMKHAARKNVLEILLYGGDFQGAQGAEPPFLNSSYFWGAQPPQQFMNYCCFSKRINLGYIRSQLDYKVSTPARNAGKSEK